MSVDYSQLVQILENIGKRFNKIEALEFAMEIDLLPIQLDILNLSNDIIALQAPAGSTVSRGSLSGIANITPTKVTGMSVIANSDRGGLFDGSGRFTAVDPGIYLIGYRTLWDTGFGTFRSSWVRLNGATDVMRDYRPASATFAPTSIGSVRYPLDTGEYAELWIEQDSGGPATAAANMFWIEYLGSRP